MNGKRRIHRNGEEHSKAGYGNACSKLAYNAKAGAEKAAQPRISPDFCAGRKCKCGGVDSGQPRGARAMYGNLEMEKLDRSLGIENHSRSKVSEIPEQYELRQWRFWRRG